MVFPPLAHNAEQMLRVVAASGMQYSQTLLLQTIAEIRRTREKRVHPVEIIRSLFPTVELARSI